MRRAAHVPSVLESPEPVGLVIADGGMGDHIPRFWAFVWGPVPDDAFESSVGSVASPATRRSDGRLLTSCP